jgi:malonyl-CoA/methylmalonyl-CoA synthetase
MPNALFDEITARSPELGRTFLREPGGRVISYQGMHDHSARFAHALSAAGVKVGDRVAVQVEKSAEALFVYLACLRVGAVFLPLNTAYTPAEIGYFLGDAEPSLFLVDPARAEALKAVAVEAGSQLETLGADGTGSFARLAENQPTVFMNAERGPDDLAAILYTSGTTGRSKGAMLSHENLASNARALVETWRFSAEDVLLHALPIFHTHGLFVATNVVLFSNASMIFLPRFEPAQMLALMGQASVMMGVPTFYVRLVDHPGLTREATARMRLFISGSAPLLAETHRAFESKTGHAILERYGMTETNMNTSNPYEGAENGSRIAGTVGFPLPGVALRITEPETGAPIRTGEIGMIEVKGGNVFKGYWRNPEKTAAEFRPDGFFITGDLGKLDERGYVHILGRGKDLIITGGYNVYPKEIEGEIDALPGVNESAVIGLPHKDFGEGVTAIVVPVKGAELSEKAILASIENRLAKFKQPKRVIVLDELPRNTMGKVQKNVLREMYRDLFKT